jgi:hypothetical protein
MPLRLLFYSGRRQRHPRPENRKSPNQPYDPAARPRLIVLKSDKHLSNQEVYYAE